MKLITALKLGLGIGLGIAISTAIFDIFVLGIKILIAMSTL